MFTTGNDDDKKIKEEKMSRLAAGKRKLLEYLGAPYRPMYIDLENCVYLDMGDHDIEISNGKTSKTPFDIYVWQKKPLRIVERYFRVQPDLPAVKALLDDIRSRYQEK